jgi:ubiquinone/menaquinone biosynthesis C-methylase UbiE
MALDPHKYYSQKLSAERLRRCYEIAPARVRQYLQAEIDYVASKIQPGDLILELGCGYGRVIEQLGRLAGLTIGIDTSLESLQMAARQLKSFDSCRLLQMNAAALGFRDAEFDLVICIQNGISAFKIDQLTLIQESLRVVRSGGRALFSSYSKKFWPYRLHWFEIQAAEGLVGEIDYEKTGDGTIVCHDGFRATTIGPEDFETLGGRLGLKPIISEIDDSSVFCEFFK